MCYSPSITLKCKCVLSSEDAVFMAFSLGLNFYATWQSWGSFHFSSNCLPSAVNEGMQAQKIGGLHALQKQSEINMRLNSFGHMLVVRVCFLTE